MVFWCEGPGIYRSWLLSLYVGEGAIEAKNVALPLLAGQDSFMKHGIIQLFKDKHPQRGCNWHASSQ